MYLNKSDLLLGGSGQGESSKIKRLLNNVIYIAQSWKKQMCGTITTKEWQNKH